MTLTSMTLDQAPNDPSAMRAWLLEHALLSGDLPQLAALQEQLAERLLPTPVLPAAIATLLGGSPTDSPTIFGSEGTWIPAPAPCFAEGGTWATGILFLRSARELGWIPREAARWIPLDVPGWDAGRWEFSDDGEGRALMEGQLEEALRVALILRSAEIIGLVRAVRGLSATHALTRIQFGRPIGAYQYIQGKLIEIEKHLEAAVGMLEFALEGGLDAARMAKAFCSRLADLAAYEGHQILAAQGYEATHPMAQLSKRLKAASLSLGDAPRQFRCLPPLKGDRLADARD